MLLLYLPVDCTSTARRVELYGGKSCGGKSYGKSVAALDMGYGGYGGKSYGGKSYGKSYGGRGYGKAPAKKAAGSYGACFKCGQPGHWAPNCPYAAKSAAPAPALPPAAAPAPPPAAPSGSGLSEQQQALIAANRAAALSRVAASAPARPWAPLSPAASVVDGVTVDSNYMDEHEVSYGTVRVPVVGCQYYKGVIHAGELANLVREPNNPYDRNAIAVKNLSMTAVGHIKRTWAEVLAPIMDDPSPAAPRAEISVPCAATNMYELSAELKLVGLPAHEAAVVAALKKLGPAGSLANGHFAVEQRRLAGLAALAKAQFCE